MLSKFILTKIKKYSTYPERDYTTFNSISAKFITKLQF